ncbi:MAG: hypothetical protein ACT4PM_02815 [Gemmatimonadales bacterium]
MLTIIAALAALSECPASDAALAIRVDLRAREVVLRTSPVDLPAAAGSGAYHHHGSVTPLSPFAWPVNGWARGFRLRILDCAGNVLKKDRLHHLLVLHLQQRELLFPIYQRLIAFGAETEDIVLPGGVGMRIAKGDSLALLALWTPAAPLPERVVLELKIPYLAENTNPRPVDVIPIGFDVRYQPGEGASFDVPPGHSTREREFEMPIGGRLLVAGGHLHDYATSMVLSDAGSGKMLVNLRPRLDETGRVHGVERGLYGVSGSGIKLQAGRRYRLAVTYDNPTGQRLIQGGMGIMAGLFSPDTHGNWPVLDKSAAGFHRDVEMLARSGFLSLGASEREPR